jgi:hypothetical protein
MEGKVKKSRIFFFFLVLMLVFATGSWAASTWYVSTSGNDTTGNGSSLNPYKTIQKAVSVAGAYDTIQCAAGTYTSGANLNKPLYLLGAQEGVDARDGRPGAQESVITAGGLGTFYLNAVDITIDGFTFSNLAHRTIDTYFDADNFTMRNCILQGAVNNYQGGGIQFGGGLNLHANGFVFEQNLVMTTDGYALYMGHAMDSGTIRNNLIRADFAFGPFGNRTGWIIEGNEFDGRHPIDGTPHWNYGINANLGDVIIRNNYVHEMYIGMGQFSVVGGLITDNVFDNNFAAAFQLWGGEWDSVVSRDVHIENNRISYNGLSCTGFADASHAIRLRPSSIDATTIHIHYNCFTNLGVGTCGEAWAIRQQGSGAADAELNYWGTTDGATIATMFGQGAVDYDPWLAGIAYTGDTTFSSTVNLILEATVATSAGPQTGIPVNFLVDGNPVGIRLTDSNGIATLDWGIKPVGTYAAEANIATGCLSSGITYVNVVNNFTITASAGPNGSISPSGSQTVSAGGNLDFTITPNLGFHIADVLVDGSSVGAVSSYTFTNVTANHTIAASFAKTIYPITDFNIEEAKIDWKKKADDDKIRVNGSFTLPPTSVINVGDLIIVTVGNFTSKPITMDAKGKKDQTWVFKREKGENGDIKDMKLEFKKNEIKFEIHIDKEDLDPMSSWPATLLVTISLQIGDDKGTADVQMKVDKNKDTWEYKNK